MDKNKFIIENKMPKENNIINIFFFFTKFIWSLYKEIIISFFPGFSSTKDILKFF